MNIEEVPILQVGEWIIQTEDGLWAMDKYSHKTKGEAVEEVSCATLDSRKTPKVKRIRKGEYHYFPKDVDSGLFGESYLIIQITKDNLQQFNQMLETQWEEDPLSQYEE